MKRRAITLLEVLVSLFVVLALIGLLALLFVGFNFSRRALDLDMASIGAANAAADFHARGFHRRFQWRRADGTALPVVANKVPAAEYRVVIDPLGLAKGLPDNFAGVPRITVASDDSGPPIAPLMAEFVFTLADDVVLDDAPSAEPPRPQLVRDSTGSAVQRETGAHFSWFACVEYNPAGIGLVDVVVVQNRLWTPEIAASATSLDGQVATATFTTSDEADECAKARWVALVAAPPNAPHRIRWYRVINANKASAMQVEMQLDGEEWGSYPAPVLVVIPGAYHVHARLLDD